MPFPIPALMTPRLESHTALFAARPIAWAGRCGRGHRAVRPDPGLVRYRDRNLDYPGKQIQTLSRDDRPQQWNYRYRDSAGAKLALVADRFERTRRRLVASVRSSLPTTSGSGIPAIQDWVQAEMPADPSGKPWAMSYMPNGLTAYVSPNNGKGMGVIINRDAHLRRGDRYRGVAGSPATTRNYAYSEQLGRPGRHGNRAVCRYPTGKVRVRERASWQNKNTEEAIVVKSLAENIRSRPVRWQHDHRRRGLFMLAWPAHASMA